MEVKQNSASELEVQIKLHINQRLYEMGLITEEMYIVAKKIILAA